LSQELLYTRLIIGGALLITWPLALFISLALVRARRVEGRPVTHLGLLLALATYLALWAPPHQFLYFLPIPITLAFALIAGRFRPGLGKTVVSWLLSTSIVLIVTVSLFLGLETTRPAKEAGAIIRFIRQQETTSKATDAAFLALPLPARLQLERESSGSPWLDSRIAQVQFAVKANKPNVPLTVELARPQQMIFYH